MERHMRRPSPATVPRGTYRHGGKCGGLYPYFLDYSRTQYFVTAPRPTREGGANSVAKSRWQRKRFQIFSTARSTPGLRERQGSMQPDRINGMPKGQQSVSAAAGSRPRDLQPIDRQFKLLGNALPLETRDDWIRNAQCESKRDARRSGRHAKTFTIKSSRWSQ